MGFAYNWNQNFINSVYPWYMTTQSSSSSSNSTLKTWAELQEERNKANAQKDAEYARLGLEIEKRQQAIEKPKELVQQANNTVVDKATKGLIKKETMKEYKKQPWWKKALRAGGNMVQGIFKLATDFIGYETDPETGERKINIKKCLKNVGIAVGIAALTCIPYVGPYISMSLLAVGVATGAIGVGRGISKAHKAKRKGDLEAMDKAFQEIGSGAFIGVSSAVGLRGMGKSLSVSHTTGSVSRSMSKNAIGQFFKDCTVNAFKATKQTANTQLLACRNNGFWHTFLDNLPNFGRRKFERELKRSNESIDNRINDINARLNERSVDPAERQALKFERKALQDQKTKINSLKARDDWEAFAADDPSKAQKSILEDLDIGDELRFGTGRRKRGVTITKDNIHFIDEAAANLNNFSTQAQNLAQTRYSTMKGMAFWNKNSRAHRAYTNSSRRTGIGRYWELVKPAKGNNGLGTVYNYVKAGIGTLFNKVLGITLKPWSLIQNSPASTWFKIETTFITPTYEQSLMKSLLGMGDTPMIITNEDGSQTIITKQDIDNTIAQIKKYENEIADLEAQRSKVYSA